MKTISEIKRRLKYDLGCYCLIYFKHKETSNAIEKARLSEDMDYMKQYVKNICNFLDLSLSIEDDAKTIALFCYSDNGIDLVYKVNYSECEKIIAKYWQQICQ